MRLEARVPMKKAGTGPLTLPVAPGTARAASSGFGRDSFELSPAVRSLIGNNGSSLEELS